MQINLELMCFYGFLIDSLPLDQNETAIKIRDSSFMYDLQIQQEIK